MLTLVVQQLRDPHAAVDRLVEDELRAWACASFAARARSPAGARRERSPGRPASRRARASSPSTLTYTRAWRRSGLVSTEVTVTNPMRGSLSPSAIRAERTSRTASFTLRMRSGAILVKVLRRYELAFHTCALGKHPPARSARRSAAIPQRPASRPTSAAVSLGALPELVMIGLGHRCAEAPLQLRLQRRQLLALALQAAVVREVQVESRGGRRTPRSGERLLHLLASRTPRSRPPPSGRGSSRARCRTPCPPSPRGRRP